MTGALQYVAGDMAAPRLLTRLVPALLTGLLLGACATPADDSPEAREEFERVNDPFEIPNRFVFAFNRAVDTVALRPVAVFYRDIVPEPLQQTTGNFLANLNEPITAVNEILQGEPDRAGTTVARFLLNSTFGVLGLIDVASELGLKRTREDFGQTLGVWTGDQEGGPYLMLPLIGPSSPRDAVGLLVDYYADPFGILARRYDVEYLSYLRTALTAVDGRSHTIEALDDIERNSLDYYAAIRSIYRQRRGAEIRNDEPGAVNPTSISLLSPTAREDEFAFVR